MRPDEREDERVRVVGRGNADVLDEEVEGEKERVEGFVEEEPVGLEREEDGFTPSWSEMAGADVENCEFSNFSMALSFLLAFPFSFFSFFLLFSFFFSFSFPLSFFFELPFVDKKLPTEGLPWLEFSNSAGLAMVPLRRIMAQAMKETQDTRKRRRSLRSNLLFLHLGFQIVLNGQTGLLLWSCRFLEVSRPMHLSAKINKMAIGCIIIIILSEKFHSPIVNQKLAYLNKTKAILIMNTNKDRKVSVCPLLVVQSRSVYFGQSLFLRLFVFCLFWQIFWGDPTKNWTRELLKLLVN